MHIYTIPLISVDLVMSLSSVCTLSFIGCSEKERILLIMFSFRVAVSSGPAVFWLASAALTDRVIVLDGQ